MGQSGNRTKAMPTPPGSEFLLQGKGNENFGHGGLGSVFADWSMPPLSSATQNLSAAA
jgi:hypothetical protein